MKKAGKHKKSRGYGDHDTVEEDIFDEFIKKKQHARVQAKAGEDDDDTPPGITRRKQYKTSMCKNMYEGC